VYLEKLASFTSRGVATQTGTPCRPKLLAIERPLMVPPMTSAPVVSVMEEIRSQRTLNGSQ
jgi:hypothetical protein